jgi:hypothetical protein
VVAGGAVGRHIGVDHRLVADVGVVEEAAQRRARDLGFDTSSSVASTASVAAVWT